MTTDRYSVTPEHTARNLVSVTSTLSQNTATAHVPRQSWDVPRQRAGAESPRKLRAIFSPHVRKIRERAADLRLTIALSRDAAPPWDRELSLALDRWLVAKEASR